MTFWCATALIDGAPVDAVRVHAAPDGTIARLDRGAPASAGDIVLGTVLPGMGDAHSHAFHRSLRGRTHANGGDFWRWRENMYAAASALDPDLYYELASAVFAEMLVSGWTAVGEFHYVHHRQDGRPYPNAHAMELAVEAAARDTGIRLTLLDTCYLRGGADRPLSEPAAAVRRRLGGGLASALGKPAGHPRYRRSHSGRPWPNSHARCRPALGTGRAPIGDGDDSRRAAAHGAAAHPPLRTAPGECGVPR
ncbi:amidohydrolase family protein [Cryobacterium breve]|uniref:amidohydrolase family protein n=1 Tax=Cryobacterium breve TaxID=1259258 RepID=UPI00248B0EE7|nr:amidohydrolase family protein [Cryobacterium breve]